MSFFHMLYVSLYYVLVMHSDVLSVRVDNHPLTNLSITLFYLNLVFLFNFWVH